MQNNTSPNSSAHNIIRSAKISRRTISEHNSRQSKQQIKSTLYPLPYSPPFHKEFIYHRMKLDIIVTLLLAWWKHIDVIIFFNFDILKTLSELELIYV